MRLNKFVALATGISRRQADDAISEGRVTIDGEATVLGQRAEDGNVVGALVIQSKPGPVVGPGNLSLAVGAERGGDAGPLAVVDVDVQAHDVFTGQPDREQV